MLALWPAALAVYFGTEWLGGSPGAAFLVELPWAPSLGLSLSFNLDGLGLLFAMLITGIGALIVLYASRYLDGHPQAEPLLRVAVRVHGRDARRRPQRQHPHAVRVLGADRLHVVPAHRLRPRAARPREQRPYRR